MTLPLLRPASHTLFVIAAMAAAMCQPSRHISRSSAKPFTASQVWKLDAIYTDRAHGVSFRYPSVWRAETQYGYWPPALTESQKKPIAGFGYEEGGFPRSREVGPYSSTNLEGFGIVYSAIPTENAADCEANASSVASTNDHRTVVFGGRTFSERETASGGMSQYTSGKLYATYTQHTCYLFETGVATAVEQVLDDKRFRPAPLSSIDAHLLNIMKSVRIQQ